MSIVVSYSIDYMDSSPCKEPFDNIDDAQEWIAEEVQRRVDYAVAHSSHSLSERDIQDMTETEYSLISITDGVVTTFPTP